MTLEEFEELKQRVADTQRDADRSAGAVAELKKRLQKTYGVKTLDAARAELKKMESQLSRDEKEFDRAASAFEKEYGRS